MKLSRILALLLVCAFLFTGCSVRIENTGSTECSTPQASGSVTSVIDVTDDTSDDNSIPEDDISIDLTNLSSEDTLRYIEDSVYSEAVETLNSEEYFVENVEAIYYSQEYIDELQFNTLENIYFGYNISELNELFSGIKYVFDTDQNNKTIVKKAEVFDDTTGKIIKNVAIGEGVILVCVTIAVVTGGAGAPAAVSAIFAVAAKGAAIGALSSAGIGAAAAAMTTDFSSQKFDDSLKNIALQASEEFKWGAIIGAVTGAAGKAAKLFGDAKQTVFSVNQYAKIQKESKYPLDVIKQFKSMKEYDIYFKDAKLSTSMINGKTALLPKDLLKSKRFLNYKSKQPDGTEITNLQRMLNKKTPIDPATGKELQLHHIGQKSDGTLAVLTESQHQGNSSILNEPGKSSEINRTAFAKTRKEFWKTVGELLQNGTI